MSRVKNIQAIGKSELLFYAAILAVVMGASIFLVGEHNSIETISTFGQIIIILTNATLVMASICVVFEKQDQWNRIFWLTRR